MSSFRAFLGAWVIGCLLLACGPAVVADGGADDTLSGAGEFAVIDRLQVNQGGASFNNQFVDSRHVGAEPARVDFAAHARSLGCHAVKVTTIDELETAFVAARDHHRTSVIVIDTDPARSTEAGGWWWEVAVPEVSDRAEVKAARARYDDDRKRQVP